MNTQCDKTFQACLATHTRTHTHTHTHLLLPTPVPLMGHSLASAMLGLVGQPRLQKYVHEELGSKAGLGGSAANLVASAIVSPIYVVVTNPLSRLEVRYFILVFHISPDLFLSSISHRVYLCLPYLTESILVFHVSPSLFLSSMSHRVHVCLPGDHADQFHQGEEHQRLRGV